MPNGYGKYLQSIFKNIDIKKYNWNVNNSDICLCSNDDTYCQLLNDGSITGSDLYKKISESECYIISVELSSYESSSGIKPIETYDDFIKSVSNIFLVIYDSEFGEVYAKDNNSLKTFYTNLKDDKFSPEYIKGNYMRNKISVF